MSIANIVNKIIQIEDKVNILWFPTPSQDFERNIFPISDDINFFMLPPYMSTPPIKNSREFDKDQIFSYTLINSPRQYDDARKITSYLQVPMICMLHDEFYPKPEDRYLLKEKNKYDYVIAPSKKIAINWFETPNMTFKYEEYNKAVQHLIKLRNTKRIMRDVQLK